MVKRSYRNVKNEYSNKYIADFFKGRLQVKKGEAFIGAEHS
jgi:hypothetical protein